MVITVYTVRYSCKPTMWGAYTVIVHKKRMQKFVRYYNNLRVLLTFNGKYDIILKLKNDCADRILRKETKQ